MSKRPFMQLYVSDFIGDTMHLSTEQIGAYLLLLMAMWNDSSGSLPDNENTLARVARQSVKKWRSISPDIMAFFERTDGKILHNRLTKELQKSERKTQSRASAGAAGGRAKALKYNKAAVANATSVPWHLPDTIKKEKEKSSEKLSDELALAAYRFARDEGDEIKAAELKRRISNG